MLKQPSAFLPVAMSLAALVTLLVAIATDGVVHETDEGTAAHIWQLLMGGQIPIVAYFAIKWLPHAPRQALYVLALQVVVALAALAPVYFLHL
jgi:peptidoglycan/LPS O-acetylase OafA/YrhL